MFSARSLGVTLPARHGLATLIRDVSIEIGAGARVALIGPSGAGKTSLFRVLNATLRPTQGTLRFDGASTVEMSARELRGMRRRVGTITQLPHLVPSASVLENAMYGRVGAWSVLTALRQALAPTRDERERAIAALEIVGLVDHRHARADELSGGQQQRVSIARVLVQDPDVILADEPFSALDPALTASMSELLTSVAAERGRTLVMSLHDVSLAREMFPRTVALRAGKVVFDEASGDVTAGELRALFHERTADA